MHGKLASLWGSGIIQVDAPMSRTWVIVKTSEATAYKPNIKSYLIS